MPTKKRFDSKLARPRVAGIGLVALDVILEQETRQVQVAAGGTCGNVLSILGYFGWNATAISRLGDDASAVLANDLHRWGVNTNHLYLKPSAKTPVIVEKIKKDSSGVPFHTFSFNCPACGGRLPQFQPVVSAAVARLSKSVTKVDVLFVDRVSRSALVVAEA